MKIFYIYNVKIRGREGVSRFLLVKIAIHKICKYRGEGGGKQFYLYIVKIENFHLVLTPSLRAVLALPDIHNHCL